MRLPWTPFARMRGSRGTRILVNAATLDAICRSRFRTGVDRFAGRAEIRGEIVTSDPVSGREDSEHKPIQFRTPRLGLEDDKELHALLKQAAPTYQGEEEESALKNIYSQFVLFVLLVGLAIAAFFLLRWLSGGGSPLTFGRGRRTLYAQKDLQLTFRH